jgi:hypothetical protein
MNIRIRTRILYRTTKQTKLDSFKIEEYIEDVNIQHKLSRGESHLCGRRIKHKHGW